MYAFVNCEDYQIVSTTDVTLGVEAAEAEYIKLLSSSSKVSVDSSTIFESTITVDDVAVAQIEGNSVYYFLSNGKVYVANIKIAQNVLPLIKAGDTINVKFVESSEVCNLIEVSK